ncbi:Macrophage mannose receptor 1 [Dissostichus eleginoides]|uniref:Macrophage mannose receptor 1 n=1 Tax=Dissostichus eleginoides TaxID=100907 RepID=A0AAD9C4W2_DISEL|nr:Macrophage mannose receptor 1 [Dissostichus eleginoides]
MVNSRSELTLSVLLFSALCLEAFIIELEVYSPAQRMNWSEARLYCQRNHVDLAAGNIVDISGLKGFLLNVSQVWMGLRRVPRNDSAWRWIDPKGGEGVSGGDFSQSVLWADGEQSGNCALVDADLNDKSDSYLATITMDNTGELKSAGWIGLHRKAGETWSWIGGQQSDFRNWAQGEPRYADCGSFDPVNQKFHSKACSTELPFLCYDDNLVVVNENKTWEDALKHCRKMESPCEDEPSPCNYKHDLLSLEVLVEYNYVRDRIYKATTDEVWTSLRFLGGEWRWSNGQQLEDQTMLPDCPSQWKHCGTLSKHDTNHWITRNCLERRNFICYRYKTVSN